MSATPNTKKTLGVAACTAIVVGNMVGSGCYLSSSALAPYGNLAVLAWVVMGAGAICLGLVFAKLARLAPATGGPYAYTRLGYGDFMGFLIGWGYWISIWASLPVIALAFAGAMMNLFPMLHGRTVAAALTIGSDLGRGARQHARRRRGGPLRRDHHLRQDDPVRRDRDHRPVLRRRLAFRRVQPERRADHGERAAAALAPLTMFAFMGMESATVPAGDVARPGAHHRALDRARHRHRSHPLHPRHGGR